MSSPPSIRGGRFADRHHSAVLAAEVRRLARELRKPVLAASNGAWPSAPTGRWREAGLQAAVKEQLHRAKP